MYHEMISQRQQQKETFKALGEHYAQYTTKTKHRNKINAETQSRSANSSEFPGFITFKLAMKIHSEKTD